MKKSMPVPNKDLTCGTLPVLSEEPQMNWAGEVHKSDRCKAAIDCEWRSDSNSLSKYPTPPNGNSS